MHFGHPKNSSRRQSNMLTRACTKFNPLLRQNRQPLAPQVFLKLTAKDKHQGYGCKKREALRFCDRIFCRVDSTQVVDGPSNHRKLKRQKNKFDYSVCGWTFLPPMYNLGKQYIQSLGQILTVTEHDKQMKKHLKNHEKHMKQDFRIKCAALTSYFDQVEKKCKFTNLEKYRLVEKLKTLKKQLKKDKREGKVKIKKNQQSDQNLFRQLDPFNMRCLMTDDYKTRLTQKKSQLLKAPSPTDMERIQRQRSVSISPELDKIDLIEKKMKLKPKNFEQERKDNRDQSLQIGVQKVKKRQDSDNDGPPADLYAQQQDARVVNELIQFNKLINHFNNFYSLDPALMRRKEEQTKNQRIIEFLEENPGIHTNVQEFLALEFNQANYVYKHKNNNKQFDLKDIKKMDEKIEIKQDNKDYQDIKMRQHWQNLIIDALKPKLFNTRNQQVKINTSKLEELMYLRDKKDLKRHLKHQQYVKQPPYAQKFKSFRQKKNRYNQTAGSFRKGHKSKKSSFGSRKSIKPLGSYRSKGSQRSKGKPPPVKISKRSTKKIGTMAISKEEAKNMRDQAHSITKPIPKSKRKILKQRTMASKGDSPFKKPLTRQDFIKMHIEMEQNTEVKGLKGFNANRGIQK